MIPCERGAGWDKSAPVALAMPALLGALGLTHDFALFLARGCDALAAVRLRLGVRSSAPERGA